MQLNLIMQPESEIISLSEAKEYLHISHDYDDELIKFLIKSSREAIETIVQKSVIKQRWEYIILREEFSNLHSDCRPCIFGSLVKIPMPRPPILEIISVIADEREIDRRKITIEKISNTFYVCINGIKDFEKCNRLTISYDAGIASEPSRVPYQIKLANLMLVANSYQDRYQSSDRISSGVRELLSPFLNFRIF